MMKNIYAIVLSVFTLLFPSTYRSNAEEAPVPEIQRSQELLQKAEEREKWLKSSRVYRFEKAFLFVDGKEAPIPANLMAEIQPNFGQFLKQDELDALFNKVKEYFRSESRPASKTSISLEKEAIIIDVNH